MIENAQLAFFLQQLINAAPVASLYAMLAFGYALSFGLTKRADFTPGALFAFSGQIFVFFTAVGWNAFVLVYPAALAMGALAALAYTLLTARLIGEGIMKRLALVSPNAVIIASLATMIVLMEVMRLAADSRDLWLSPFLNTRVVLWDVSAFPVIVTHIQLLNSALMVLLVVFGSLYLTSSISGRRWLAVSDDAFAARLLGVDSGRVVVMSHLATALYVGLAGILATAYYGSMDFGSGLMFGLKVVLIAGVGEQTAPQRSAIGAAIFGVVETFWGAYVSFIWRDLAMIGFLVLLAVLFRQERRI